VVRRGTTCLCSSDRRAPDRRAGPRREVRRLVTIVRREAAAGVSAALLHFADACCAAGMAVPPVLPAGKEPRNFALHRVKQLAVVRQLTDIIQRPPATPPPAGRTWVLLTETPEGGWGLGGHANTNAELAGQIAVIPPAGPGVRRSESRGSAIRKIFRPSPTLRDGWEPG
jgi:hypothetical protein